MASKCPECGEAIQKTDEVCPKCGVELAPPPPPPRPAGMSDGAKYGLIVGILVVSVGIILLMSGAMSSGTCKGCKGKGYTICVNCKDGTPKCILCKGTGSDPQTFSTCLTCMGSGRASICPKCKGQQKRTCTACGGEGSRSGPP